MKIEELRVNEAPPVVLIKGIAVSQSHHLCISMQEQIKELDIDLDRAKKGRTPLMGSDGKRKRNLTPEV